jgi:peptide/nickel transport system substrate-binding protein
MRYDPATQKYEGQSAESVTANADSSEWTLKLKPGIKFSDGTDYDADAVVFGMKRHVRFGSRTAGLVGNVKEYTVVDKLRSTRRSSWRARPRTTLTRRPRSRRSSRSGRSSSPP